MSIVTFIDEAEAPPTPPAQQPWRSAINIDHDSKRCRTCERILPMRMFGRGSAYLKHVDRYAGTPDCLHCMEQQRRAAGIPKRMAKVNGRGEVWCSNCKRYLPSAEFRPHPNRNKPGKQQQWWAYCKPCCRELDRLRWRGDRKERNNASRTKRQRRQARVEFAERREFLAGAIELLLQRGITLSGIARIIDVALTNLYKWRAKATRRPTKNVMARFERLLMLTMDWPLGQPAFRNRLPHPNEPELIEAMAATIAANPVRRGRWGRKDDR